MALSEESQAEFSKVPCFSSRAVCQIGLDFYLHNFPYVDTFMLLFYRKEKRCQKGRENNRDAESVVSFPRPIKISSHLGADPALILFHG